jgi:hypothetical protein
MKTSRIADDDEMEKLSRARNVKQFVVRAWSWRNICTRARNV